MSVSEWKRGDYFDWNGEKWQVSGTPCQADIFTTEVVRLKDSSTHFLYLESLPLKKSHPEVRPGQVWERGSGDGWLYFTYKTGSQGGGLHLISSQTGITYPTQKFFERHPNAQLRYQEEK